jgi:hypothetical protein
MSADEPTPGAGDEDRLGKLSDLGRRVTDIAVDYGRAVAETQADAARQAEDAARAFAEASREAQDAARRRLEEAGRGFGDALREASRDPSKMQEAEAVYRSYLDTARQAWDEAARRSEEAARSYEDALRAAQEKAFRGTVDAYRTQLKSLQEMWARLDVDGVVDSMTEDGPGAARG